jgi:hypothetical protein
MYRLSVSSKDGVPPFGPEVPEPAIFDKDDVFRDFLLCKRSFSSPHRQIHHRRIAHINTHGPSVATVQLSMVSVLPIRLQRSPRRLHARDTLC